MRCKSCLLDLQSDAFYASNAARCKECVKASVRANRVAKIEHYRDFDRKRANSPDRVAARAEYAKTTQGQIKMAAAKKRWNVANAMRKHASSVVNTAIIRGKLEKQPCFICGDVAQAHHPDYSAPLAVSWL